MLKVDKDTKFYRFQVPSLSVQTAALNPNGFFTSSNIALLTLIQRRDDPLTDYSLPKDVYGYHDNDNIYKFTADGTGAGTITAVQKIAMPNNPCINVFSNRMIDVGRYQLVVYSECSCTAVSGQTLITHASLWFYTFSTQAWTCMDLPPMQAQANVGAWTVPITTTQT